MSADRASPPRLRAAIVALGITQIIGWGTTFYVPAVLARPVAESLGLPLALVLGAYSWCLLVSGLLSRRIGALIDRRGAAPILAAASVLASLALGLHAAASGPILVWIAWTLIGLGMRAMLYDGAFAALAALAGPGSRRAISLLTLFGGLASTLFWPISLFLLESFGWRATLLTYALLNLLVCAPLHWCFAGRSSAASSRAALERTRADPAPTHRSTEPGSPPPTVPAIRDPAAHRERAVLLLSAALALHAFVWSSLAAHLPALLTGLGLGAAAAVGIGALMGPAQVIARSLELFAQRWLSPLALAVPVFGLIPLAFVPLAMPLEPLSAAAIFVIIYGCGNGLLTILRGALPLSIIGPQGYGELLGRIAAPTLYMSALSPVLFAEILERFGAPAGATVLWLAGMAGLVAAALLVRHSRGASRAKPSA